MKILLLLLTLVSARALANNCAKDAQRLCGGIEPGKNQIYMCLQNYEEQLTSDCKKEMTAFRQKTNSKNPCFTDLADFCVAVDPSKVQYCLLKNESRLSANCSKDFKKKKGNLIVKNQCALDIANTCYKEVTEPEGAINKCLIRNKDKLSKFCQNNVNSMIGKMKKANPCFDDQEKFCPTQLKFFEIHECLEKKTPSLSPACREVVQKEQAKVKSNPCYKDLMKHCVPGLSPNAQVRCLTLNDQHLTTTCRQYRAVMEERINKMVTSCEKDRLKLCPKAPLKDGMVLKCLKEKRAQVSVECRNFL